jgi:hypothetical protein
MKTILKLAASSALVAAAIAAAAPASAADVQFASTTDVTLTYSKTTGDLTGTTTGVTLTFLTGSQAATLFPSGILTSVAVTASGGGALTLGDLNPASPKYGDWADTFTDTDLTITYTGATTTVDNVTLTHGEVIAELTGVTSALAGDYTKYGHSGNSPIGVNFTFDDAPPPGDVSDYTGGGFFDFSGTVLEDDFSFTDSSSRGPVTCTSASVCTLGSFTFHPNGNLSADPAPPVNGIPEPTSWALMILGVGAIGGVMRRRRALVPAAA